MIDDLTTEKIWNEQIKTPKTFKLKVTTLFETEVIATSLDEAMDYIMDSYKGVYSIEEVEKYD